MRTSAATGDVDFDVLNDFFNQVIDRALSGGSPVRRWKSPTKVDDGKRAVVAAVEGDGGESSGAALSFVGTLMADITSGSSVADVV